MYKLSWILQNSKKLKVDFFLKTNSFSKNQMTSEDNKRVDNRHVWFDSNAGSGKGCNAEHISKASP